MSDSEMKQIEKLKAEVTRLQGCLADRNRQLDAMHWAWCSGGCTSGMHRWSDMELTEELLRTAEHGVSRMRQWLGSNEFRKQWAVMSAEEREAWMQENAPSRRPDEDASLTKKVEHALEGIRVEDEAFAKNKAGAEERRRIRTMAHRKLLDSVEERFEEIAFEVACEAKAAPYSRNGQHEKPESVHITTKGFSLSWDDNNGHYTNYLATWDDLEKFEKSLMTEATN
jgi:hypothetical protein